MFGSRLLQPLLMQSCTLNLTYNALITVFLVYAIRSIGLSASRLGFVIGTRAVLGLVGALVAARVTTSLGLGRTLLVTTLGASQAVAGVSAVVLDVATVTLRQVVTPNRLLARMNGSYRMLLFGMGPLGAIAGGALGSALGLRQAMVVTAIAVITPTIWILFSPVFRLAEMPSGPDENAVRDHVRTAA